MLKTKSESKTWEIFASVAKIRYSEISLVFFFCFSDLHSYFKIVTQTAKINTIKIKKNCRKVKNKLEQKLT